MKTTIGRLFTTLALFACGMAAEAQGTAFTYQGQLKDNGALANALYDLRFTLYDAASGGAQQGSIVDAADVGVTNGLFTVALDFGSSAFTGPDRWLEIGVRPGASAGAFTNLVGRQQLTATPYATYAGNVNAAGIAGLIDDSRLSANIARLNSNLVFTGTVVFANPTSLFGLQVGSSNIIGGYTNNVVTGFGNVIAGGGGSGFGTNMIFSGTYNVIGAGFGNKIQNSSQTIVGSGQFNAISNSFTSGILSGSQNLITNSGSSLIGAGTQNLLKGAQQSIIGAGDHNFLVDSYMSAIASGNAHWVSNAPQSFIGGGCVNYILDSLTCGIDSGWYNTIEGNSEWSFIGGGRVNVISGGESDVLGGGWTNSILYSDHSVVGGGWLNVITFSGSSVIGGGYDNNINANYGTISGGHDNTILSGGTWGTIPGGWQNTATNFAFAAGRRAKAIHSGAFVWADSTNADFASTTSDQFNVRASGGVRLETGGAGATLDGQPIFAGNAFSTTLIAGSGLRLNDSNLWFRAGTDVNHGLGWYGIGKTFASAAVDGPVLFGFTGGALGTRQFGAEKIALSWNSSGNVGIGTNTPGAPLDVAVASGQTLQFRLDSGLVPGIKVNNSGGNAGILRLRNAMEIWPSDDATRAGKLDVRNTAGSANITLDGQTGTITCVSLTQTSDRNAKENFDPVDAGDVLNKVVALPLSSWNYKADEATRHLGPMAQDFYAAFHLGPDDKHIATVDEGGVALAAIQGLYQKLEEKEARIQDLEKRLNKLEQLLTAADRR